MRQWNLLRLRDELHKRGVTAESFKSTTEDVTKLLRRTHYQPISSTISSGGVVRCVALRSFEGLLRWQTQTDTYFSREISDRVRVISCLTTLPNIIHSDSTSETLATSEWQAIKKATGTTDNDTIVIVWGEEQDAESGAREIAIRAKEATIGIPSETRQALRDGTNGFERILPGPDRMYPDTDLPPKPITNERLDRIRATLPQHVWEREAWYNNLGIPKDVVQPLAISSYASLFEFAVKEWNINPTVAGVALVQWVKRLKKKRSNIGALSEQTMKEIFLAHKNGSLVREGIFSAMQHATNSQGLSANTLPAICTSEEVNQAIKSCEAEMNKLSLRKPEKRPEVLMGLVMESLRGRIDGATVARRVEFTKNKKSNIKYQR